MSNVKQATRFHPSNHAVDQVHIRFGVEKADVHEWIRNEMKSAHYVITQPDGCLVYDSADARIIVTANAKTTVTVTPLPTALPVHAKVRELVARQLRLATARHRRDTRQLAIELARLNVEIAQLRLNQRLAKSPVAQAQIERKVAVVNVEVERVRTLVKRCDETLDTERRAAKMYGVKSV